MTLQVTLHLKVKHNSNPTVLEAAAFHRRAEYFARRIAHDTHNEFDVSVVDVFRVDSPNHLIENFKDDSPF